MRHYANQPVPYDFCVGVPILCLLTVGSTPVSHSVFDSVLNVKAVAGAFNQEKALVGAVSVIVKLMEHYTALVLDLAGDGLLLLPLPLAGQHCEGLGLPEAGVPGVRGVEDGELLLVRGVRAEAGRDTPHNLNRIIISGPDSVALSQCWDHLVFVRE